IGAADHVIELGPGPGRDGGQIVFQGPREALANAPRSLTRRTLAGEVEIQAPHERRKPDRKRMIRLVGARENNLHALTVAIPLHLLVCVTGVSGSGKSTLVDQVLYRGLRRAHGRAESDVGALERIEGAELVAEAALVDQSPLGASSRVNAATYLDALGPI